MNKHITPLFIEVLTSSYITKSTQLNYNFQPFCSFIIKHVLFQKATNSTLEKTFN